MEQERYTPVTLSELISEGLIEPPTEIEGIYYGRVFKAKILADGTVRHEKNVYNSLSVAAGCAITDVMGITTSDRKYIAINGWNFWHLTEKSSGHLVSLGKIRNRLP